MHAEHADAEESGISVLPLEAVLQRLSVHVGQNGKRLALKGSRSVQDDFRAADATQVFRSRFQPCQNLATKPALADKIDIIDIFKLLKARKLLKTLIAWEYSAYRSGCHVLLYSHSPAGHVALTHFPLYVLCSFTFMPLPTAVPSAVPFTFSESTA
jgi:hypothetical protein